MQPAEEQVVEQKRLLYKIYKTLSDGNGKVRWRGAWRGQDRPCALVKYIDVLPCSTTSTSYNRDLDGFVPFSQNESDGLLSC
jgi:hypothetical protein